MKKEFQNKAGFGCVSIGTMSSLEKAFELLNLVHNEGVNYFDTAPVYSQGYSEVILGKFIEKNRESFTVATKFGLQNPTPVLPVNLALPLNKFIKTFKKQNVKSHLVQPENPSPKRIITLEDIQSALKSSLKSLRTDYIDNYLLHEGTPDFLTPAALDYLFTLKAKGIVKKIGIGVCYKNIVNLPPDLLENWDILQYEGYDVESINQIYYTFKDKQHHHHSIFNYANLVESKSYEEIIKIHKARFPAARIVFSSTNPNHIKTNIKHILNPI